MHQMKPADGDEQGVSGKRRGKKAVRLQLLPRTGPCPELEELLSHRRASVLRVSCSVEGGEGAGYLRGGVAPTLGISETVL